MPNNIKNLISFKGSKTEIQDLMSKVGGFNDEYGYEIPFDFERIIPMPEEEDENWYEWRIKNWGTKWNAYSHEEWSDCFEFETAWAAPHPVMQKLSEMYPSLQITHKWADEDIGHNCGKRIYQNGKVITERAKADGLPKDVAYAKRIWKGEYD